MVFRDWQPEPQYHTDTHNIAAEFYGPCMRDAVRYDRITGFFSSAIYLIVWPEIVEFAKRDGRIRIICSPTLSVGDAQSIATAYTALTDAELAETLLVDYHQLLENPYLAEPAKALAGLIVDRVVDFRIAEVDPSTKASSRSMFHDKTGLFFDDNGDVIGFRGGLNETYLGLAIGGNVDSIDAWASWQGGSDAVRVHSAIERFDALWNGKPQGVKVSEVPDVALEEFSRVAAQEERWELKAEAIAAEAYSHQTAPDPTDQVQLRCHQQRAIDAWETNDRRGLLEHATGSGKTVTAIEAIRAELTAGNRPVVLVPSALLLAQWQDELRRHLADLAVRVHPCGDGQGEWRDLLGAWLAPTEEHRVVVATIATATSDRFLAQLRRAEKRIFLVGDEAHRLGATGASAVFEIDATARLGLSATPHRSGDPVGTTQLLDYFGGIVDTYTIADALADEVLTPYAYEPHLVELNDEEQQHWEELSAEISQTLARLANSDEDAGAALNHPAVRKLLITRARVIKKAAAKVQVAGRVVGQRYRQGDRWLVYCEDQDQLDEVVNTLMNLDNIPVTRYLSTMPGDRSATMRNFARNGGVVVSIRCLDEGVDVPVATHALILASSRNPREFIQRRGRVLRRAKDKAFATIHDAIVVPKPPLEPSGKSMILGELARAMEFADHAFTLRARGQLSKAFIDAGGNLDDPDLGGGFEPDDEDE